MADETTINGVTTEVCDECRQPLPVPDRSPSAPEGAEATEEKSRRPITQDDLFGQPDQVDLYMALCSAGYVRQLADSPALEDHESSWLMGARDAIESLIGKLIAERRALAARAPSGAAVVPPCEKCGSLWRQSNAFGPCQDCGHQGPPPASAASSPSGRDTLREAAQALIDAEGDIPRNCKAYDGLVADLRAALATPQGGTD